MRRLEARKKIIERYKREFLDLMISVCSRVMKIELIAVQSSTFTKKLFKVQNV
jgi:hypothetical protein